MSSDKGAENITGCISRIREMVMRYVSSSTLLFTLLRHGSCDVKSANNSGKARSGQNVIFNTIGSRLYIWFADNTLIFLIAIAISVTAIVIAIEFLTVCRVLFFYTIRGLA